MVESFRPEAHGERVASVLYTIHDWRTSDVNVAEALLSEGFGITVIAA
jgi:hypothetical protein